MEFRFERVGVDDIRSTGMQEEVASLCAYGLLERVFSLNSGPVIVPTPAGRMITESSPMTVGRASERIHSVARAVADSSRKAARNVVLAEQRHSDDGAGRSLDYGSSSGLNGVREPKKMIRSASRADARAVDLIEALAAIKPKRWTGPFV